MLIQWLYPGRAALATCELELPDAEQHFCRLSPVEKTVQHAFSNEVEAWHKWIIPEADLSMVSKADGTEHLLGSGACGAVYKGLLRGTIPVQHPAPDLQPPPDDVMPQAWSLWP